MKTVEEGWLIQREEGRFIGPNATRLYRTERYPKHLVEYNIERGHWDKETKVVKAKVVIEE